MKLNHVFDIIKPITRQTNQNVKYKRNSVQAEGKSNSTQESKSSPFISSVWVLAAVLGAAAYVRKMK